MLNKQIAITFFVLMNIFPLLSFGQCKKWEDKISIITTDNDTIIGYQKSIKHSFALTYAKLIYKDENCAKQKIEASKIKFILHASNKFVLKNIHSSFVLLRLALDRGNIKYYNGTYIQKANDPLIVTTPTDAGWNVMRPLGGLYSPEKIIEYHYVEKDKILYKIKSKPKPFLSKMKKLFGDCPEIKQQIKAKEYTFIDLYSIVRIYTEWLEKKEEKSPSK